MAEPPLDSGMQMPEISSEEILKQIFGDIGELIDGFSDTDYKPKIIAESSDTNTAPEPSNTQKAIVSDPSVISTAVDASGSGSPNGESSNSSSKRMSGRPSSSRTAESDDVYDTESGFRPNSSAGGDQAALFEQEVAKSKLKISVITETLPVSLTEFYNLYIAENAPFSFKKYHEAVKDTNLAATPWSELSSSLGHCREIKFFKPVNLPGLASTRGVKVQRFRRFENVGLVLCSSTRLEDVPAADTFSVEDMISVKALDPQSSGGCASVAVEITFQVTFIKSTYMKYIIDRSTNFEMTKWLEAFFAHLKKTTALFREGKVVLDGADAASPCPVAVVGAESLSAVEAPSTLVTGADSGDANTSTATAAAVTVVNKSDKVVVG
eukprot:gene21515-27550_t